MKSNRYNSVDIDFMNSPLHQPHSHVKLSLIYFNTLKCDNIKQGNRFAGWQHFYCILNEKTQLALNSI